MGSLGWSSSHGRCHGLVSETLDGRIQSQDPAVSVHVFGIHPLLSDCETYEQRIVDIAVQNCREQFERLEKLANEADGSSSDEVATRKEKAMYAPLVRVTSYYTTASLTRSLTDRFLLRRTRFFSKSYIPGNRSACNLRAHLLSRPVCQSL